MFRDLLIPLIIVFITKFAQSQDELTTASTDNNQIELQQSDWLKSTRHMLAGPSGQMLVQLSQELLSRTFGGTQILSLNLTNFCILLLLKALLFIAGIIGAGSWHFARGRNVNDENDYWLSQHEKDLYMGFLAAETGEIGCLSKAACYAPAMAKKYSQAARVLLKGFEQFGGAPVERSEQYNDIIRITEEGSHKGYKGISCDMYNCRI